VGGGDAVDHRQPETRSPALAALREKRLEEMFASLRGDARTVVGDLQNGSPRGELDSNTDAAAVRIDGVARVEHEVDQQPPEPHRVSDNRHGFGVEGELQLHLRRHQVAKDSLLQAHQLDEIESGWRSALAAGEEQELAHDLGALLGEVPDRGG